MSLDSLLVKVLTDDKTRDSFARDPRRLLRDAGVDQQVIDRVPATLSRKSIDLATIELNARLARRGVDAHSIAASDPQRLSAIVKQLGADEAAAQPGGTNNAAGGDFTPPLSIVLIVLVVVTLASGRGLGRPEETGRDFQVTREAGQLTLHGPGGMRVHGLDVSTVAEVMKRVMKEG